VTISVIIPTLNEAKNVGNLVTFIKQLQREEVIEILVVDGGSGDETCQRALSKGATVVECGCRSRAVQMNLGASHSRGDVLYFVHADVTLLPSFVDDIHVAFSEGFVSGCYRYVFDANKFMLKVNAYFTRFNSILCRGGDQTMFVSRSVFWALGGFNVAFTIMEDFDFIIRLRKCFPFKIIQKDVIVSARKYAANSWLRVQMANLLVFVMFFFRRSPNEMKQIYKILLTYR